jgi:hypothetical protein
VSLEPSGQGGEKIERAVQGSQSRVLRKDRPHGGLSLCLCLNDMGSGCGVKTE